MSRRNNYKKMAEPKYPANTDGKGFVKKLEIPPNVFDSFSKNPVISFYTFIANELNIELETIDVSNIAIGKGTMRLWNEAVIKYLRARVSSYRVESELGMTNLVYAPMYNDVFEDGIIYIRD